MLNDDNIEEQNTLFESVIALYAAGIENTFSGARLRGTYTDLTKDSAIMFKFIIQPYRPELCCPEDIGVIKPITMIDGHLIKPSGKTLKYPDIIEAKVHAPAAFL